MKAILEFNLPDENNEFTLAQRGSEYFCVLHEIMNHLRGHVKYDVSAAETIRLISDEIEDVNIADIA